MRKQLTYLLLIGLVGSLLIGGCAKPAPAPPPPPPAPAPAPAPKPTPPPFKWPKEIAIATLAPGSVMYQVASGWSEVLTKHTPMTVVAKSLAGSRVFMPMVDKGEVALCEEVSPTLSRAWKGQGEWKGAKLTNTRIVFLDFSLPIPAIAVRADSDMHAIKDLKGKRLASDYGAIPNSRNFVTVALISGGLTWDDVIKVPVSSHMDGIKALREGRVDATFGFSPTASLVREVDAAIGLRFIGYEVNPEEIPEFHELLPGDKGKLLKPPLAALKNEQWGVEQPFWYLSSTHFSDEFIYQLLKVVWDNYQEIQPIHPIMKGFSHERMLGHEPTMPYHPGAVRFFKEKGVWTDKLEQKQKELLGS